MKPFCLFASLFAFILFNKCPAQDKDRILKIDLQQAVVSYRQPRGFLESDSSESVPCAIGSYINPLKYSLKAKKADVIVGISFQHYSPPSPLFKRLAPKADQNKNYLRVIELEADTTNEKVIYYTKEFCKKKFNADVGAEYVLSCHRLFRNKYPYCKVVILHKENRSDISLFYYYTKESKKFVPKIIKQTAGTLRYKDL